MRHNCQWMDCCTSGLSLDIHGMNNSLCSKLLEDGQRNCTKPAVQEHGIRTLLVVNPVTVIIFEFGKEGTCLTKVLYRVNTARVTMYHIDSENLKLEGALFRSLNTCTLYAEFPWCLMLITEPEYCSMTGENQSWTEQLVVREEMALSMANPLAQNLVYQLHFSRCVL